MKINKVKIASFGKFKNKEIDFSDGFNLVYGENEMGKTTLMEFIKMMFYGSKVKGSDAVNNPRKRYMPWNEDKMAGSIEFEHGGTFYRLDREFRSSNSTDKVTLWNLDTGESESVSGSEEIGARFFTIGAGAFEKSLFIANDPSFSADAAADGEINAKLSCLTASYEDDTSAEQVLARVRDAANALSTKTGRGGSIAKLESEKAEIISQQRNNAALCFQREELEKEIDTVRFQIAELDNKRKEYFEKMKNAERTELKERLNQFVAAAQDYEETEQKLKNADGEMITAEFLEVANDKLNLLKKYESENISAQEEIIELTDEMSKLSSFDNSEETATLNAEKQKLLTEFETFEAKIKETEMNIMSASRSKENLKSKPNFALIIVGAVLVALGVALGVILNPYFAGICAVGGALAVIGIIKKKNPDSAEIDAQLSALETQKEDLLKQKNAVSGKMQETNDKISRASVESNTNEKLMAAKREENIHRREKQLESMSKTDAVRRELFALLVPFGCKASTSGAEQFLKDAARRLNELEIYRVKAENAAVGTKCSNLAQAKEKLAALGDVSSNENSAIVKEKMAAANEEKARLENRLTELTAQAKNAFKGIKTPVEFEKALAEIDEKINSQKMYYDRLKTVEDALTKASALLRRNFSGALEQRAIDIFSGITGGRYTDISVSKNFDINLQNSTDFGAHSVQNLSKGTADQAYFSLRLALSEAMGKENGGLPIFLDDVFSQYDDRRSEESFKYLIGYSKDSQIIFFTCHGAEKQRALNCGANIIEM